MKHVLLCFLLTLPLCAAAQNKKPPTDLRGVLLEQLRTTHDQEDWFVPASIAVAGLTADQAKWSLLDVMSAANSIDPSTQYLRGPLPWLGLSVCTLASLTLLSCSIIVLRRRDF